MPNTEPVTVPIRGKDELTPALTSASGGLNKFYDGVKGMTAGLQDLRAGMGFVNDAFQIAEKAYSATVGEALKYASTVRQLSRVSGQNAEETSRLIQLTDDLGVETNDLEAAMSAAARKGIAVTTESIAQLADKYAALSDPVARNTLLIDNFGRSGLNMAAAMVQGGDAIRKMAGEVQSGLILTDQQVQAARNLEIQNDNLKDSWSAMAITLGTQAMPAITDSLTATNDLANTNNIFLKVLGGIPAVQALIFAGYTLNAKAARESADATKSQIKANDDLVTSYGKTYKSLKELNPGQYSNVYETHNPGFKTNTPSNTTFTVKNDATLNVKLTSVGPQNYGDLIQIIQKTIRDMQAANILPKVTR